MVFWQLRQQSHNLSLPATGRCSKHAWCPACRSSLPRTMSQFSCRSAGFLPRVCLQYCTEQFMPFAKDGVHDM